MKSKKANVDVAAELFPIIGIGASAGGLAAFQGFFSGMPKDSLPGMAFLLVQHLAPDHPSSLTELVQRFTKMSVLDASDGAMIEVDCCYIIQPKLDMSIEGRRIRLTAPLEARGHRCPINVLFNSLATDLKEHSIAIVLSGTGSDGTLGVRSIHDRGGLVITQSPNESEFDGMPLSAIATGLVDYQLAPNKMIEMLTAYVAGSYLKEIILVDGAIVHQSTSLQEILALLKSNTGHDFSRYKPSTILRRIERRMTAYHIGGFDGYLVKMQKSPEEVTILFKELLIGVTSFFRDPDAFAKLELSIIPSLLKDNSQDKTLRVWVAGCSTGEEAYSLAILLQERVEYIKKNVRLMIFATDIDDKAIAVARAGVYPKSIESDVSAARLSRFFNLDTDGKNYRIHKSIRDSLIFSEHDLIRDPPFSKIDLITCRNLLIYFERDLQSKVIALFHYALTAKGFLFLGSSESVGEFADLYSVLDRKAKLYQRREDLQAGKRAALARFLPKSSAIDAAASASGIVRKNVIKPSLREVTEQAIVKLVATVAMLVNNQGDILYLHGRSGLFLEPASGDASINNVLKMAREGLKRELETALYQVALSKQPIRSESFNVKTNDGFYSGRFSVCSVAGTTAMNVATELYLIVLEEAPGVNASISDAHLHRPISASMKVKKENNSDISRQIRELSEQLRSKEEVLQSAIHELENSNEELKSSNEEMQSVNEELQSTNEEVETAKEEMQSVNEELSTVNTELQLKVNDTHRANNDMNNLLAGTGIGTVFLDLKLRVLRFTPAATKIIPLINSDIGRPVAHLMMNLIGYDTLVEDVNRVLDSLVTKEITVQTVEAKFYTLRILPYRTLDNVVEGAVITFIEITEMVQIRLALRKANDLLRLAVVVRDSFDAITAQDLDGRTIAWNPGAVRMYGWTEQEALSMNVLQRTPKLVDTTQAGKIELIHVEALEPYRTQRLAKDGRLIPVFLTSTTLLNDQGQAYAIATTEREDRST